MNRAIRRGTKPATRIVPWLALTLLLYAHAARAGDISRFALVVGNNHPERSGEGNLRYADDDAIAVHKMLLEVKVKSVLLTTLDDDTRRFFSEIRPTASARREAIDAAFATLAESMRKVNQGGGRTEFLFFFSGHGDVDKGEGYLVLEEGRFTRRALYELLTRSPASRNHVIIDACKSYFLAFEKGLGGQRQSFGRPFAISEIPSRLANTGFVLSTSADRDSHEWERYQAGILSYEVRSAMRGAADLNRDGHVSYAELGAFVATANRGIDNAKYRPEFTVRPPGGRLDEIIFDWPADQNVVAIELGEVGRHIYIETARGERVLDAHPQSNQFLALHLPTERPLFIRQNDEKAESSVANLGPARVLRLEPVTPEVARRGALHMAFEQLFAFSFGAVDIRDYTHRMQAEVTTSLPESSGQRSVVATAAGVTALVGTTAGVSLGLWALREYWSSAGDSQVQVNSKNRTISNLRIASLACLGVAAASAITWAWLRVTPDTQVSLGAIGTGSFIGGPGTPAGLRFDGRF